MLTVVRLEAATTLHYDIHILHKITIFLCCPEPQTLNPKP